MDLRILVTGGIIIFSALVIFIILFIFLYQKRYYRHLHEKEQLRAEFARESLNAELEIQEQTLQNIAQEIHDNVGQVLSLAKLNLNTLDISKQPELEDKITNSKNLIGKAIQDLRDLSRSLNTEAIMAMGLAKAIGNELEIINKSGVCQTQLDVVGESPKMDAQQELIIFRIVQESLHNILKHAVAKTIKVSIHYTNAALELNIEDDGKGFDVSAIQKNNDSKMGMGIRNMQNRARLIKAEFNLTSTENKGTHLKMILPLNKN
jgi:signal transduction histidine kinase